ncbi:MAG: radical SAM protein [Spirochaetota bacterium]
MMKNDPTLVFCDTKGNIYDLPGKSPSLRTGRKIVSAEGKGLVKLPFGSEIFSLPGRRPVSIDNRSGRSTVIDRVEGREVWAASSFLPSGYLRTYLPGYQNREKAVRLSLWAYAGVLMKGDDFYAPGIRIDDNPRSDPELHTNDDDLVRAVGVLRKEYPSNRLVGQLARCAQEYRCLCARNFFLGRFEAPVPTSPVCNARCLGCLSYQQKEVSGFCESQYRLEFAPEPAEIAQVILHHFERTDNAVASFGQGCEGEPLMRGKALAEAIKIVRSKTSRGTIHLNTNGSLPDMAALLFDAGLDSIRVSLNSPTRAYYDPYYLPQGYIFDDVMRTVQTALDRGIYLSVNLFFLPGFTDMESEAASLRAFLDRYPVNMIQTRNLNIDPDYYLDTIGFRESEAMGIEELVAMLRRDYPKLRLGYYNPPKEEF